jgi:hypothetical protein
MAKKNIEVLIVNFEKRVIGIDCGEVNKVIARMKTDNDRNLVKAFKDQGRLYDLAEIMGMNKESRDMSYISTEMMNGTDILIAVPDISSILNTEISDILVVPEFIRRWQKPFFVWGFLENEGKMISLVTFSFFNNRG